MVRFGKKIIEKMNAEIFGNSFRRKPTSLYGEQRNIAAF